MAIAFSNSASATGASGTGITTSFNMTGSTDTLLLVHVTVVNGTGTTGVTFNGNALTIVNSERTDAAGEKVSQWAIVGQTGTANVVSSWGSTAFGIYVMTSYTGVNQSATPDSSNFAQSATNASTLTTSTTVVASNCWLMMTCMSDDQAPTAGSGTFLRQVGSNVIVTAFDSNGTVSTGSQSLIVEGGAATTQFTNIISSWAPSGGTGPANLKTWNGIAKANLKTLNGIAIANVKTVDGIS